MPLAPDGEICPRKHLTRRTVWIGYAVTLIIAGGFHAGKAADDRGAFVRWRHQIHDFWQGENIWDRYMYPNPPILPIVMSPLMVLPPVAGALVWFALKASLACVSAVLCFRMAKESGQTWPAWALLAVFVLSLRPILSDLHHGNNNLIILALVVAALYAWRQGYDVLAGLTLALAITFKVTPALFVPYFVYKRSWRIAGATCLGVGIFLLVVPSLFLGPRFNGQCLAMWWHRILSPFIERGITSPQEVNQSMVGVLSRLLTEVPSADAHGNSGVQVDLNLVAWDPRQVVKFLKLISLALVGLLAVFCRTRATRRDDPRLLGEFSLVVLTMLFVSERSWKHHFVTLLLPTTYLVYRMGMARATLTVRWTLAAALALSAFLMATTSSELGAVFGSRLITQPGEAPQWVEGHKLAQYYGLFLWSSVVLYIATAWRVVIEGRRPPSEGSLVEPARGPGLAIPAPHLYSGSSICNRTIK